MPEPQVREAMPSDAALLAPLCAEHAAFEGLAACMNAHWSARLATALATGRLRAWLVCDEGVPLGYASATLDYATLMAQDFMHMDCLYLREQARGRGLGARLMRAVVLSARAGGYRQLQWQTPHWNEAAARFYRRQGAAMLSKRRFVLEL